MIVLSILVANIMMLSVVCVWVGWVTDVCGAATHRGARAARGGGGRGAVGGHGHPAAHLRAAEAGAAAGAHRVALPRQAAARARAPPRLPSRR